jgi:crotonobetainyl-CoA:carnitine CoA-transferase CaiB-like acyl-CoA transferase
VRVLYELVKTADVFLEGFRPGVASRLGADWEALSRLNPALVYCSISAAGQKGPYAHVPMHDLNLQGLAGLDEGHGIGVPWVDLGTATTAALAIVAYWHRARMIGLGVYLDAAMLDTAALWGMVKASAHGRAEPTYGIFETADGRLVAVAILEDHIWQRLCQAFGWVDWREEPEFGSYSHRVASATIIRSRLEKACRERSFDALLDLARRHDLPITPAGSNLDSSSIAQLSTRRLRRTRPAESPRTAPIPLAGTDGQGGEQGSGQ